MCRRPLFYVVALSLGAVVCPIFLPLVVFLGYPVLLIGAAGLIVKSREGEIQRPSQPVCFLVMFLGLVMILHGIAICWDSSLGGSPSEEDKRFGNWVAYLGAGVAGISAGAAYFLDPSRSKRIR